MVFVRPKDSNPGEPGIKQATVLQFGCFEGVCWLHRPGATDYRGWKIPWSRAAAQWSVQADDAAISKATGRGRLGGSHPDFLERRRLPFCSLSLCLSAKISVEEEPRIVWVEPTASARFTSALRMRFNNGCALSTVVELLILSVCSAVLRVHFRPEPASSSLPPLGRKYGDD